MSDATSRADLPADCPDDTYRPHSFEPLIAAVASTAGAFALKAPVFSSVAPVKSAVEPAASSDDPAKNDNATAPAVNAIPNGPPNAARAPLATAPNVAIEIPAARASAAAPTAALPNRTYPATACKNNAFNGPLSSRNVPNAAAPANTGPGKLPTQVTTSPMTPTRFAAKFREPSNAGAN